MMGVLMRYVAGEQVRVLLLTVAALGGVDFTISALDKMRGFTGHDAAAGTMLQYLLLGIPKILYEVLPFSLLIATVLGLGMLSGRSEITAMRAAGIGLTRVAMPLLLVGGLFTLLMLWAGMGFVPQANATGQRIMAAVKHGDSGAVLNQGDQVWFRSGEGVFFGIQSADVVEGIMWGVRIMELDGKGGVSRLITARRMVWDNNRWTLEDGRVVRDTADGLRLTTFETRLSPLDRPPHLLGDVAVHPDNLTSERLARYVARLTQDGYNATPYRVDLAARGAFPFVALVMVLVAIPFGLTPPRSHGLARGIGICLLIALVFWLFYSMSLALGRTGVLAPALSAWLPVAVFAALGAYRLLGVRG
ncbi:MAG: LPS export ABC transporter permease LptG [Nitrospirota bacterium]|nr:LPS export ABC transporter permease LptG [Nitrospirota bacterium]